MALPSPSAQAALLQNKPDSKAEPASQPRPACPRHLSMPPTTLRAGHLPSIPLGLSRKPLRRNSRRTAPESCISSIPSQAGPFNSASPCGKRANKISRATLSREAVAGRSGDLPTAGLSVHSLQPSEKSNAIMAQARANVGRLAADDGRLWLARFMLAG